MNPLAKAGVARDTGSRPGWGRSPGVGNGNPFQYSCLENSMDRSLVGYSSWNHKELDTNEHTHTHTHTHSWETISSLLHDISENPTQPSYPILLFLTLPPLNFKLAFPK